MDKIFDEATLAQSSIFELRNIARELGVYSPTIYKKEELIAKMMQIVNGEVSPYVPKSKKGRPPKNISTSKILDTVFADQDFLDQDKFSLNFGDKTLVLGEHVRAFLEDNNNKPKTMVNASGYFTLSTEGYGLIRDLKSINDISTCVYVSSQQVDNFKLRVGDYVTALTKVVASDKPSIFVEAISINGQPYKTRTFNDFDSMPVEFSVDNIQVAANNSQLDIAMGKCTMLLNNKSNKVDLMNFIKNLNDNNELASVLVGLEVTKETELFFNSLANAEAFTTLIDQSATCHSLVGHLALQRAKRLAESGEDVVLVVDGLDKVVKNQNLCDGNSLLDLTAKTFESAKQFLGCARKFATSGSLTVVAVYYYKPNNTFDQTIIDELEGLTSKTITLS